MSQFRASTAPANHALLVSSQRGRQADSYCLYPGACSRRAYLFLIWFMHHVQAVNELLLPVQVSSGCSQLAENNPRWHRRRRERNPSQLSHWHRLCEAPEPYGLVSALTAVQTVHGQCAPILLWCHGRGFGRVDMGVHGGQWYVGASVAPSSATAPSDEGCGALQTSRLPTLLRTDPKSSLQKSAGQAIQ